jgi:basic membrane lipoprotein Med (substrate-binding protein (PBP1-ABC) superfamily)
VSKFQSTISTVAALASIFGAAAAGWKLAQSNTNVPPSALDQKIEQLEQKIKQTTNPAPTETTEVVVPSNQVAPTQIEQKPVVVQKPVAPVPPPPPIPESE